MQTKALAEDLARLPAQAVAAVRVLQTMDDPNSSAAGLARLIETDPVLSARVLRLANAPYYGLARRVSSAARAVVLLGLSTVRALAVSAAVGLLEDGSNLGPAGFWPHSVTTAAASSVLARHVGVSSGDAFSAGLIHDLGAALLYRRGSERYRAFFGGPTQSVESLSAVELEEFGVTHARAGADVFETWRFPPRLVRAVSSHHEHPAHVTDSLGRVVIAGESFALHVYPGTSPEPGGDLAEAVEALALSPDGVNRLLREVRQEIDDVSRFLRVER